MPSGHTHTLTTVGLAGVTLIAGNPALTAGVLSGLVLSPDLDVDDGFIGFAHLRRIGCVGGLLSGLWRVYWYPYARLVPHRSHISHSVFFGTVVRVFYLILPVLLVNVLGVTVVIPAWFGMWFIGLCLSDALHIALDWLPNP